MNKPKTRLRVKELSLTAAHRDGRFYPMIDGTPWGENGRGFWSSYAQAMQAGIRIFNKVLADEQNVHASLDR